MQKEGVKINCGSKESVFRIYRDIRFSKDKTPYKLHMSALLSKEGRKDFRNPGIYLELGADYIKVYSGIYEADKEQLEKIKNKIKSKHIEFKKLYSASKFKSTYTQILGEKMKTPGE